MAGLFLQRFARKNAKLKPWGISVVEATGALIVHTRPGSMYTGMTGLTSVWVIEIRNKEADGRRF